LKVALYVVVDSVQVISGTLCAVLAWLYGLSGNSQEGGKQRQRQLQIELRDLLALGVFRQIQFTFTSPEVWQAAGDTGIDKWPNESALFAMLNQ
jgi:hypothetical protein